MDQTTPITRERIAATEAAIRRFVRRTPLVKADMSDFGLPPGSLTFKLEMLQHSGSFKARGAFANLLLREVPAAGVVAASGGNHGAAVAWAAKTLGIPATIFLPTNPNPVKRKRIAELGANLIECGGQDLAHAFSEAQKYSVRPGIYFLNDATDPDLPAGSGTRRRPASTRSGSRCRPRATS